MTQHFNDTRKVVNCGVQIDSFAKHFAEHSKEKIKDGSLKKVKISDVRDLMEIKVLWKGNPISCMKSFGKLNC